MAFTVSSNEYRFGDRISKGRVPRFAKHAGVVFFDSLLLVLSLYLAIELRLSLADRAGLPPITLTYWLSVLGLSFASLLAFRLHRIKLETFDQHALSRLALYSASLVIIAICVSYFSNLFAPRSVAILFGMTFFVLGSALRYGIRFVIRWLFIAERQRLPIAIYGAGAAGIELAGALRQSDTHRPAVFVDDNPALQGFIISGLKVVGAARLSEMVAAGRVAQVFVAIPSMSALQRSTFAARFLDLGCNVQFVPSYADLLSGRSSVTDLREVRPDELLDRDKVELDTPEITRAYAGRCVMVTGAGGSIGSELCRQILTCRPKSIVLFERSEHALYEIDRAIGELAREEGVHIFSRLGSVIDQAAVTAALEEFDVDIVLHAAAYKHVPLIENNEIEGARNNVVGTHIVAEAAQRAGIERFILVSTDKAVRPTNVMGATKRMAELIIQDIQSRSPTTKFSMVRFGNVLGSSGSVVPLFQKQIEQGGPLTVTDEEITRYFMTIPEAARLVLLAGAYSEGGDLFVLDMGRPIKIMDLAQRMVELSGRTLRTEDNPEGDINIEIIGLRPGEKLHEELFLANDQLTTTPHRKIFASSAIPLSQIEVAAMLRQVNASISAGDSSSLRATMARYVQGFGVDALDGAPHDNQTGRVLDEQVGDAQVTQLTST
ncbi:MAG: nucleoside-diphosphate sugar epimerase/dehydratase [Pseudomonadota bacterium]